LLINYLLIKVKLED